MSAIKNYTMDVAYTVSQAVLTEAKEELKACIDFDGSFDLFCFILDTLTISPKGAKATWDMVNGLIGDMPWDAEHPLLDEAKNQLITLIPFGELAKDLSEFLDEYDPYEFRNCFDSMDEAIEANIEILASGDEAVLDRLNECLENMDGDEVFKETIATCESLIPRVKQSMELANYYRS